MGLLILHKDGAYNLYSTITDSPRYDSALTRKQLDAAILQEEGREGLRALPERLERAHRAGSSSRVLNTLSDVICCNRAGPREGHLSQEEFVRRFLTLPKNKFQYMDSMGNVPTPESRTGFIFSDAVVRVGCPKCGSDAGYHCQTPRGRKAWPPHNPRIAALASQK